MLAWAQHLSLWRPPLSPRERAGLAFAKCSSRFSYLLVLQCSLIVIVVLAMGASHSRSRNGNHLDHARNEFHGEGVRSQCVPEGSRAVETIGYPAENQCKKDVALSGRQKLTPVDPNKLLLFVGQDIDSVADYASNVEGGSRVSGVTTYTALSDKPGASLLGVSPEIAKCPIDYGAGVVDASALLGRHPHAALNVGLDITQARLAGIVRGAQDENLRMLGRFIKDIAPRPVYLRIGYECDGPWNHYNPKTYPAAFAYIVEFLRNESVQNFASVWQVSTSIHANADIRKYWPGAHVVDWVGSSYFEFHPPAWKALAKIARANNVPVLICEAAPQGYDIPRGRRGSCTGDGSDARRVGVDAVWNAWFRPFFKLVHKNRDIIRGVSYINCNWESQTMWNKHDQGYWGNTVVTSPEAAKVKRLWEAEVNNADLWLQANPDLWTKQLTS